MTRVKIDLHVDDAVDKITNGAETGVRHAVEHLLTSANRSVPHDEGTLERSGQASTDGTRGAVSYDTPYAVKQHEDMSQRHDGKGRSKWLEAAFGTESGKVGQIVATAIRSEVH